ncbi:MAG: ribonucleoside-diphosphate reductase subunit alpha [Candidatus Falkowbacteria bacterium]
MNLHIKKRDGQLEPFNADKINQAIAKAAQGLAEAEAKVAQIASETTLTLYDGISSAELDQAIISSAAQNIKEDPAFDRIASRLLAKVIYKEVLGHYQDAAEFNSKHANGFYDYVTAGINSGYLDKRLNNYDLKVITAALTPANDDLLTYTGLSTMQRRYLSKDHQGKLLETPQYFWMRVAMGLAINEQRKEEVAISFYQKMSALEYLPGGSTNINAGTARPRLSNCYLMDMEDSIEGIGKTVTDVMKLSKATGGIGLNVTRLRANGSAISTNNTFSSGPVPFLHIIDSSIRAISRAGKKMGALCFYMENWHLDFEEFLDLKSNSGDEYRRTRTANTAVYMSDEFMRRVAADDYWYMFDPHDVSDLIELYGQGFDQRYQYYCQQAEKGQIKNFKKIKAAELYKKIIVSLISTSHPWLTWKDAINVRALNNNTGTIHSSNLCTEITLPQDKDNISVCNLLSINLARHLTSAQEIDWPKFEHSVRLAVRQLDNLVDINEPPVDEAYSFDRANRALGLGIMGLADIFEQLNLAYDSQDAYDLADRIFEFMSYMAIDESAELAKEKGSYQYFDGSGWSQGLVPIDTLKTLASSRGETVAINQTTTLDWDKLRAKVKNGMRNSTLMAIAPTANIGLVAGTSPGIDPRFAQIFSRNTLSGKYLELNFNLVLDLKKIGLWEQTREQLLANYGSLADIEEIPQRLKAIYKDSFSVAPEAYIEIAALAQKWIDQAISRNMYLETRDSDEVAKLYQTAWRKGLKTTYYLHMKPRHSAEQSTVKVNKSASMGRRGFGAALAALEPELAADKTACPLDPMERLACDSCQ